MIFTSRILKKAFLLQNLNKHLLKNVQVLLRSIGVLKTIKPLIILKLKEWKQEETLKQLD
jgi:hypothetical protein